MKFLLSLSLMLAVVCITGGQTFAAPPPRDKTKVKLHILPLECVLEKINNGITDIHSLKPADCKKRIDSVSPPPFTDSGDISIIPLPYYAGQNAEDSDSASSDISIKDLRLDANEQASVPERNLFIRAISMVLQTMAGILVFFFIGYVVLKNFFELL